MNGMHHMKINFSAWVNVGKIIHILGAKHSNSCMISLTNSLDDTDISLKASTSPQGEKCPILESLELKWFPCYNRLDLFV